MVRKIIIASIFVGIISGCNEIKSSKEGEEISVILMSDKRLVSLNEELLSKNKTEIERLDILRDAYKENNKIIDSSGWKIRCIYPLGEYVCTAKKMGTIQQGSSQPLIVRWKTSHQRFVLDLYTDIKSFRYLRARGRTYSELDYDALLNEFKLEGKVEIGYFSSHSGDMAMTVDLYGFNSAMELLKSEIKRNVPSAAFD